MKFLYLLFINLLCSSFGFSQNQKTEIQESKMVTLPITATQTTDPNYEINKKKSADVQKKLNAKPVEIVKNENYYIESIKILKSRIKDITTNPNTVDNPEKLNGLIEELERLEVEYKQLKEKK